MATQILNFSSAMDYVRAAGYDKNRDWLWDTLRQPLDKILERGRRGRLISRIRRELLNNEYLRALVFTYVDKIGTPIMRAESTDAAYNTIHEIWYARWARNCERSGLKMHELIALIVIEYLVGGEIFMVRQAGKFIPIQSEYCTEIKTDADGKPTHFVFQNTVDGVGTGAEFTVATADVDHLFIPEEVYQNRGVPALIASLLPMNDIAMMDEALTHQIISANNTVAVLTSEDAEDGEADPFDGKGATDPDAAQETEADAADKKVKAPREIKLKKGAILVLRPNEKFELLSAKFQSAECDGFITRKGRAACAPLGLPWEFVVEGFGQANYSSSRAISLHWSPRCSKIRRWITGWMEAGHNWASALSTKLKYKPAPPQNNHAIARFVWPRDLVLDEAKEAEGILAQYEAGLTDVATELEKRGERVFEVFMRRRTTYIMGLIASGKIPAGADTSKIIVPEIYIHRGKLPEELKIPVPAAPAPAPKADPTAPDAPTNGAPVDPAAN